uniref:Uncharacterized protein n=1 Tax=Lepeophtheirus salmonis TaxID=72036 RepID=A0A0K2VI96_LEPSM
MEVLTQFCVPNTIRWDTCAGFHYSIFFQS